MKPIGNFFYNKKQFIGGGAMMKTFIGYDKSFSLLYAVKIQTNLNKYIYCKIESKILEKVKNFEGLPKLLDTGYKNGNPYMIENLIGPTLHNIILYLNSGFSICTVSKIGIQLLDIFQKLHDTGILNCDL